MGKRTEARRHTHVVLAAEVALGVAARRLAPHTSRTNSAYPETAAARTAQSQAASARVCGLQPRFPLLPHRFSFLLMLMKVIAVCHLGLTLERGRVPGSIDLCNLSSQLLLETS